jgi:hypothetical protein
MGKFLRVLVIILLLLSAGALWLGILLFAKRELLKGRTQKLENRIILLGKSIEAEPAKLDTKAEFEAKDTSPCKAEANDNPERSQFWTKYKQELEVQDLPTLEIEKRRTELMSYYKIDPATGQIARDVNTGAMETTGEGTMENLLQEIQKKANDQIALLNETRQQLKETRVELEATIKEHNGLKKDQRTALKKIVDLEAEIVKLKDEIAQLKTKIEELEKEITTLKDKIAELEATIKKLEDTIADRDAEIKTLKKVIAEMSGKQGAGQTVEPLRVTPGIKGRVSEVNAAYNYLVLDLDEAFIKQLLGEDYADPFVPIEFLIKRPDQDGKVVTKVRLFHLRREKKLGVADILPGWTQMPIKQGDAVVYERIRAQVE